jgi:hypothetical protein
MLLNADFFDQTKHRTLIFGNRTPTADNATLTVSMIPTCLPITVISIALVNIDVKVSSHLRVLLAEIAFGSEELEGLGFDMDGQCIKRDVGIQITAHQVDNSAQASCSSSNEQI